MAFLKRQNVKPSIDVLEIASKPKESSRYEPLLYEDEEYDYTIVKCKWISDLYQQFNDRSNDEWLRLHISRPVEWISIHYYCLLDCVLTISHIKVIEWADVAELTNAFTFLVASNYFKNLPEDYPFTKAIVVLRDKLKLFCLETHDEDWVQLQFKFSTKKDLLLQRYELACVFCKISFNQLQLDFKNEYEIQVNILKQEQNNTEPEKEKLWWIKYRALKRQEEAKNS